MSACRLSAFLPCMIPTGSVLELCLDPQRTWEHLVHMRKLTRLGLETLLDGCLTGSTPLALTRNASEGEMTAYRKNLVAWAGFFALALIFVVAANEISEWFMLGFFSIPLLARFVFSK